MTALTKDCSLSILSPTEALWGPLSCVVSITNNSLLDFPYLCCPQKEQDHLRMPVIWQQIPCWCIARSCSGLSDPITESLPALMPVAACP